jgi:CheY-like chemotaxis protein
VIILIVDDEPVSRRVLRRLLSRFPELELREAENGQVAWEKLGGVTPDLILCDLLMPVMDGMTFIRKLREHSTLQRIPVIVTSASKDLDLVLQLKDLGLMDYLLKPFDLVQTFARLEKHIVPLLRAHRAALAVAAPPVPDAKEPAPPPAA